MTVIATICWARTSSGLRGMRVVSIAPSCIRRVTIAHSSRSPRYFGKMIALARRPDLVAGPADPLQPARHARRALDLDDEVDRAHVDPELEAGRRDQRRQPAVLEGLLDLDPLLAGDAAVVGADQLLAGQLVEPLRQPLGQAAAVGEDDRAPVAPDELEDARVDGRPDARAEVAPTRRATGLILGREDLAERRHVVDGDDDLEVERLARAGVDDLDLAIGAGAAEEPGDRVERPLRRGQADPLGRAAVAIRRRADRLAVPPVSAAPARSASRRSRLRAR